MDTPAFKIINKKCKDAFSLGAEFTCDICDHLCFKRNIRKLYVENYEKDDRQKELFELVSRGVSDFICNSCHLKLKRCDFPPNSIKNVGLHETVEVLSSFTDLEHAFICQIVLFMKITARHKGAQCGLKGQVVLVPTDITKIQKVLPRSTYAGHLITVAIKRRLKDLSAYIKQNIRPEKINAAFIWLKENNTLYKDVEYDEGWAKALEEEDPELWNMVTKEATDTKDQADEITDSDTDDDQLGDDKEQIHKQGVPRPSVIYSNHGPDISVDDIIEVAPGEGQIPVNSTIEPDFEALAFPKLFPYGRFHENTDRPKQLRSSLAYFQCRMKGSDPRFACDNRYPFVALDIVEKEAIHKAVNFSHQKAKNTEITVGQLRNAEFVKKMISDQEMFSVFKKIRGTPQYWKDMQLDVLAKVRYFGVYTFWMTWSAAQFQWNHIIKLVGRITFPRKDYTDEEVDAMDWSTKANILKRHPVLVARQIDYIFETVWNKVVMGGVHPLGQILNYDQCAEYQSLTSVRYCTYRYT